MKSEYFVNCKTIEELKQEYRRLVKKHHPDCNESENCEEIMKVVNNEYDFMFNLLQNAHNSKAENATKQNTERPEDFRNVIIALMKLDGLIIEICGSWIWLSGDTYKHKDEIKKMGFKWAGNKKMWYLGETEKKRKRSTPMEDIRNKYGSEVYKSETALRLA